MENKTVEFKAGSIDASKIKTWVVNYANVKCTDCGIEILVDINSPGNSDALCLDCQFGLSKYYSRK